MMIPPMVGGRLVLAAASRPNVFWGNPLFRSFSPQLLSDKVVTMPEYRTLDISLEACHIDLKKCVAHGGVEGAWAPIPQQRYAGIKTDYKNPIRKAMMPH